MAVVAFGVLVVVVRFVMVVLVVDRVVVVMIVICRSISCSGGSSSIKLSYGSEFVCMVLLCNLPLLTCCHWLN